MSVAGFAGICRIHRAQILRLRGKWVEAEREVLSAAAEVRDFRASAAVPEAFYELGEIRLRLGNFDGAADAFRQAHELGREPLPGLALLWLEQGRGQAAASKLAQALADLPREQRLKRARLLPAQVHVAVRLGDLDTAIKAFDELQSIVAVRPTRALEALASTAEGTVLLAKHDAPAATAALRRAIQLWTQLDAPFEAAQARLSLASAYRLQGDGEAADLELQSARSAFQRLGATQALATSTPAVPVTNATAAQLSETLAASAPLPSTSAAGSIIDGKLELTTMLGRGGMGVVFAAKNRNTGRDVAVKILRREVASDPAACQRMLQEALACGRIQHPNVVDIYDAGSDSGQPYIVMELLRGESLAARIDREHKVNPAAAVEIAAQALAGIAAAHSAGIVHRDLKPDNLFLANGAGGLCVKVVDFGISKLSDGSASLASTHTGAVVGTPYYMSPEQANGQKDIDARTDIYAVGALLFHALTGRPPYLADNYNALLAQILTSSPPSVRSLAPEIPAALDAAIDRALSRDPEARQPSADAFAAELRAAI
jgi:tetratricopeptide (TPR) repeat protein